jgi:hypothetical protein
MINEDFFFQNWGLIMDYLRLDTWHLKKHKREYTVQYIFFKFLRWKSHLNNYSNKHKKNCFKEILFFLLAQIFTNLRLPLLPFGCLTP